MADSEYMNALFSGGIWPASSVEEVPEVLLMGWYVFELENGDRHFCGYNVTEGEGRVSSKIEDWNPETHCGKTASGRVYQLLGTSHANSDADYVWNRWRHIYRIERNQCTNVSSEYSGKDD